MIGWLNTGLLIAVVGLVVRAVRRHRLLARASGRVAELEVEAERVAGYRASLRNERRRVRRSHRLKRRAQRVVGMVRSLAGCNDARAAARRGAQALVDGFGASGVAIWSCDATPRLLAQAGDRRCLDRQPPATEAGPLRRIVLADEDRRPVAVLLADFERTDGTPLGLASYLAVLGAVLGARREPPPAAAGNGRGQGSGREQANGREQGHRQEQGGDGERATPRAVAPSPPEEFWR